MKCDLGRKLSGWAQLGQLTLMKASTGFCRSTLASRLKRTMSDKEIVKQTKEGAVSDSLSEKAPQT